MTATPDSDTFLGDHVPGLRDRALPRTARRVLLADVLPLVRWGDAEFRLRDTHGRPGYVDLVVIASTTDSRHDPDRPVVYRRSEPDYNPGPWTEVEALHVCPAEYATVDEALAQVRQVARLLVLHEVDETLRFGGRLAFDPHTAERERIWPPTEEWP